MEGYSAIAYVISYRLPSGLYYENPYRWYVSKDGAERYMNEDANVSCFPVDVWIPWDDDIHGANTPL